MSIFQVGNFKLASGQLSQLKIECDSLTKEDWEAAALLASKIVKFGRVEGVPRGGLPFADALKKYANPKGGPILIVDDVWTTGGSMNKFKEQFDHMSVPVYGIVLFARNKVDRWVTPIFSLNVKI